ncbi:MAG: DUF3310 domain-containing protein [Methyloprofundus sp.]|nr:DUF3310 domain-containing protein [Methyloprofundus sp.]
MRFFIGKIMTSTCKLITVTEIAYRTGLPREALLLTIKELFKRLYDSADESALSGVKVIYTMQGKWAEALLDEAHAKKLMCYFSETHRKNVISFFDKDTSKTATKHPLMNENAKHYDVLGVQTITQLEKLFTREELRTWAKITYYKYMFRLGKKDAVGKELEKMENFKNYYEFLNK